jgi:hypothetical protein
MTDEQKIEVAIARAEAKNPRAPFHRREVVVRRELLQIQDTIEQLEQTFGLAVGRMSDEEPREE